MADDDSTNISEIIRTVVDDNHLQNISLTRSMRAVAKLASRVVTSIEKTGLVMTGDDENDLVLGYEVARLIGVERSVLHHDEGILSLEGASITGKSVTFLSLFPPNPERVEALRLMIDRASSSLDIVISAFNASEVEAMKELES